MSALQTQRVLQHLRQAVTPDGEAGDGELLESFLLRRDEQAFAALLRRHGPMVWGVCRRLARQECDAEDTFQAVFLILVRNADRVWPRDRVGAWLHGVAFRTARKARHVADRRRAREKQLRSFPHPTVEPILPNGDLRPLVDKELRRLPERLRLPLLLCDIEGRPQREVARQLGLPVGTLCHRLATARTLLARRLARRGVTLSLAALAAVAVPRSLAAVTSRAAVALAAGRQLASLVPPQIADLTEGALNMTPSKFRLAAALVLVAVLGGLGLHARHQAALTAGENEPPRSQPAAKAKTDPAEAPVDDRTFLRRISMDLRGMPPTDLEMNYFLADTDKGKRRKVAGWMVGVPPIPAQPGGSVEDPWKQRRDFWLHEQRRKLTAEEEKAIRDWLNKPPAAEPPPKNVDPKPAAPKPGAANPLDPLIEKKLLQDYRDLYKYYRRALNEKPEDMDAETHSRWKKAILDYEKALKPPDLTDPEQMKKLQDFLTQYYKDLQKAPPKPEDPDETKRAQEAIRRAIDWLRQQQEPAKPGDPVKPASADPTQGAKPADLSNTEAALEALGLYQRERVNLLRGMLVKDSDRATDAEFLRRVMLDILGILPTPVEMNYFIADKDPNKRHKVVDWLLANPAARKQMEEQWKDIFMGAKIRTSSSSPDRFRRLVDDLMSAGKKDDQVLEALCLASLARFPTESERTILTAFLRSQTDRRAACQQVLSALTDTQEFRQHVEALNQRARGAAKPGAK